MFLPFHTDFVPPEYTFCPLNKTKTTKNNQATAVVYWEDPIAIDNSNQEPNITCDPKPGSTFEIGETKVHCNAEDKSGNIAKCNFFVDVTDKPLHY